MYKVYQIYTSQFNDKIVTFLERKSSEYLTVYT